MLPSVLLTADCIMECQQQQWWFGSKVAMQGGLILSPGNPLSEVVCGTILIIRLLLFRKLFTADFFLDTNALWKRKHGYQQL